MAAHDDRVFRRSGVERTFVGSGGWFAHCECGATSNNYGHVVCAEAWLAGHWTACAAHQANQAAWRVP